jgi:hypothetical protein
MFPGAGCAAVVFIWLGQPEPTPKNAAPTGSILSIAA